MKFRRWDIVFVRAPDKDAAGHPGVVLSHEDLIDDPRQLRLNVLVGTKKPPAQPPAAHQVFLDAADGLDFPTWVDCSLVYLVNKPSILRSAGNVSWPRRQEIQRKVRSFLGLG